MRPGECLALALAGVVASAGAGCGDSGPAPDVLRVFAASSLTEPFQEMARSLEASRPGMAVSLQFAGSQVLALQIEHGAHADVFASADPSHMRRLVEAGWVSDRGTFAINELALIVPLDNPAHIEGLADLPRARRIVIGTESVPVGAYARLLLRAAAARWGQEFASDVLARVVSEEVNVRLVRAKVELGEADAALVYRTDAAASRRVRSVPIPADLNVAAEYSIGVVETSDRKAHADAWLDLVFSDRGRGILERHGFVTASTTTPATVNAP